MKIDWKQKAEEYKKDYLKDLKTLVAIDSSRDLENADDDFPLGMGPGKALEQFLAFGDRDGFSTTNIDNIVGYIEYGVGDETMAILGHADEMPTGLGWDTDPFELTKIGENVYGRGVSDDKGPALAAYYGLRILKDLGIKPKYNIRLIIGTDEECDWTGMKRYFDTEPAPAFGFSPDAEFPLINGEKGNASFEINFEAAESDGGNKLISFDSGLRENMVPRDAEARLKVSDTAKTAEDFEAFLKKQPVSGNYEIDGDQISLSVVGKAAHGMEPKNGINAGTFLALFLSNLPLDDASRKYVSFIAEKLHDDSRAHQLGLNFTDKVMGELTMNVGLMKYGAGKGGMVNTNIRYPKGITPAEIDKKLETIASKFGGSIKETKNMDPHYVDPSEPIVKKLLDVYREQTGQKDAEPEVVGGGTYARLMKKGVAFGELFPGTPDTMHQANEFQPIKDLITAISIYGQSIYELVK